jgi:hypothetical protein
MSSFLDKFIADTYHGVLHSDVNISASGLSEIFDGDGNQSSLSLGRINNGAKITGTLQATNATIDQTLDAATVNASNLGVSRLNALDINTLSLSANSIVTQNLKAGNVTYPISLTDITLFGLLYPVGSIYLNVVDVNPGTYFSGTTWIKASEGRFLVGAGVGYDENGLSRGFGVGLNNGEYYHALTPNEMPSHTHTGKTVASYEDGTGTASFNTLLNQQVIRHQDDGHTSGVPTLGGTGVNSQFGRNDGEVILNATGGNAAHNVTPPSFGVFVWQRTA